MEDQRIELKRYIDETREQLLDLSTRNKLIHFNHSQSGRFVRFVDELPNQVFQSLLAGKSMTIDPLPDPVKYCKTNKIELKDEYFADSKLFAEQIGIESGFEVPDISSGSKHADTHLQTIDYPDTLNNRLNKIRLEANRIINETGNNTLYLSIGFLDWEEPKSKKWLTSPLILVPVEINRDSKKINRNTGFYDYTVHYTSEDLSTNLSLKEKLRRDTGIILPDLENEDSPEDYFDKLKDVVAGFDNWKVRRYMTLSFFSFGKLLLYLDLDYDKWENEHGINGLLDNINVQTLLGIRPPETTINDLNQDSIVSIDELNDVLTQFPIIYDADSSQHSALIDAVNGKNTVIVGPPGSGKSQTITNLIAAALYNNLSILFVSEKKAALDVVYSRLQKAGLGHFCLELHSDKSNKKSVLDNVKERIQAHSTFQAPEQISDLSRKYYTLVKTLRNNSDLINTEFDCFPEGESYNLHNIFCARVLYGNRIGELKDKISLSEDFVSKKDKFTRTGVEKEIAYLEATLDSIFAIYKNFPDLNSIIDHPWSGVSTDNIDINDEKDVFDLIKEWDASIEVMIELIERYQQEFSVDFSYDFEELNTDLQKLVIAYHEEVFKLPENIDAQVLKKYELTEIKNSLDQLFDIKNEIVSLNEIFKSREISADKLPELIEGIKKAEECFKPDSYAKDALCLLSHLKKYLSKIDFISKVLESACNSPELSLKSLERINKFHKYTKLLDPTLIKHRNSFYEDDESDKIINSLEEEILLLTNEKDELGKVFKLDLVPTADDLNTLILTLRGAGFFGFFKSSVKQAKIKVQHFTIDGSIDIDRLSKLNEFKAKATKLEFNDKYSSKIGALFEGLNSNLNDIKNLRSFYRELTESEGFAFGNTLAKDILALDDQTFKAFQNLDTDSFSGLAAIAKYLTPELYDKIDKSLSNVNELKSIIDSLETLNILTELLLDDKQIEFKSLSQEIRKISLIKENLKALQNSIVGEISEKPLKETDNFIQLQNWINKLQEVNKTFTAAYLKHGQDFLVDSMKRFVCTRTALQEYVNSYQKFEELLNPDPDIFYRGKDVTSISTVHEKLSDLIKHKDQFNYWFTYCDAKDKADLSRNIVQLAERRVINSLQEGKNAFYYRLFSILAKNLLKQTDVQDGMILSRFVEDFREVDNELLNHQRAEIAHKLSKKHIPEGIADPAPKRCDLGLINKEISKKRAHIPLRQLIERAGDALKALKPCFLMSPISVAHFLPAGQMEFDIIVMDEASQIKAEEAIGSIARAKQVIVVGDPKQMPPSRRFESTGQNNEDEDEDVASDIKDIESILSLASDKYANRMLNWHYRSKHQDLIAFSNSKFYNSKLTIFPSPFQSDKLGVKLFKVEDGTFISGENVPESVVIVDALIENIKNYPGYSIGIVSMNIKQRDLIQAELDARRHQDPAVNRLVSNLESQEEEFFIKNLENVQGDERDIIMISITYGPKESGGRVLQSFGDVNRLDGERRLNVLFTRAKHMMHVYSSLSSGDIQERATSREGVIALKEFLKFCETGIINQTHETGRSTDSFFEDSVIESIESLGYKCKPQVGEGSFRIDVGVCHPEKDDFVLAVECDGATYHSSKSSRDRDRLRQSVLESLGWVVHRIWSRNWFYNSDNEKKKLKEAIEKAIQTFEDRDLKTISVSSQSISSRKPSAIMKTSYAKVLNKSEKIEVDKEMEGAKKPQPVLKLDIKPFSFDINNTSFLDEIDDSMASDELDNNISNDGEFISPDFNKLNDLLGED